jgi:hypothetical protein
MIDSREDILRKMTPASVADQNTSLRYRATSLDTLPGTKKLHRKMLDASHKLLFYFFIYRGYYRNGDGLFANLCYSFRIGNLINDEILTGTDKDTNMRLSFSP